MGLGFGCLPAHVVPVRLKNWLKAEKLSFVQLIGEQSRNTLFCYSVTLESGLNIKVFQYSHKIDSICVSAVLDLLPHQIKKLSQKSKVERETILSEARLKLACVDVSVTFGDNKMVVSNNIYFDGLTKDRFFNAVSDVEKAYSLAGWVMKQLL